MKVWMRLGVELELSKAEVSELTAGPCSPQRLLDLVQSDRCKISGNSYFPEIEQNGAVAGLEWDIPETPAAQFFVDTPDGVLVAYKTGDIDYPGIVVERKADKQGEPGIAMSLRACLKTFDKNGGVGDNRKKQAGAGENASIPK